MVDGVLTGVEIRVCIKRLGEHFTYFISVTDIFLLSRDLSVIFTPPPYNADANKVRERIARYRPLRQI